MGLPKMAQRFVKDVFEILKNEKKNTKPPTPHPSLNTVGSYTEQCYPNKCPSNCMSFVLDVLAALVSVLAAEVE